MPTILFTFSRSAAELQLNVCIEKLSGIPDTKYCLRTEASWKPEVSHTCALSRGYD